MEETYLDVKETLEYFKKKGIPVKKSALYVHIEKETIPFFRFGKKRILFSQSKLDGWIEMKLQDEGLKLDDLKS